MITSRIPHQTVEQIDVAVIGAGVTGLASAGPSPRPAVGVRPRAPPAAGDRKPARTTAASFTAASTTRPGWLKTTLCVEGRGPVAPFCRTRDIAHSRCGKLIVARPVSPKSVSSKHCSPEGGAERRRGAWKSSTAPLSPGANRQSACVRCPFFTGGPASSKLKDSSRSLLQSAQAKDAVFLPATPIVAAENTGDRMLITNARNDRRTGQVVNAAGLYADDVSLCARR